MPVTFAQVKQKLRGWGDFSDIFVVKTSPGRVDLFFGRCEIPCCIVIDIIDIYRCMMYVFSSLKKSHGVNLFCVAVYLPRFS